MKTRTEQAIFVEIGKEFIFNGDNYKMLPDETKNGELTGNCMAVNLKSKASLTLARSFLFWRIHYDPSSIGFCEKSWQ